MTPTLLGRWQTRIFLLATVGALITLPFHFGIIGPGIPTDHISPFFPILGYVALFGIIWDVIYISMQQFRWDRDWPGAFQLLSGIWEAIFILIIVKLFGLPGAAKDLPIGWFTIHYSLVWLGVYLISQSLMRVLFPRWRFHGGRLL
ncbi:MAG: hypothetical protein F6J86_03930 [Symploca sp. SIO1B1]|nr:hypothetical protein [Symploca sp. SIO1C2]NER47169.1 hypothetical protein [Symploca sp. SIO1A3]NER92990.1 hypothetical protein [Symploca sp. SIO1B1]